MRSRQVSEARVGELQQKQESGDGDGYQMDGGGHRVLVSREIGFHTHSTTTRG